MPISSPMLKWPAEAWRLMASARMRLDCSAIPAIVAGSISAVAPPLFSVAMFSFEASGGGKGPDAVGTPAAFGATRIHQQVQVRDALAHREVPGTVVERSPEQNRNQLARAARLAARRLELAEAFGVMRIEL